MQPEFENSFQSFREIARSRRSARSYLPEAIPDEVLQACFDVAIHAPSSHNLEIWRFLDVREPAIRARLNRLCLDQPQATQAPTLIVAVARPDLWRIGCRRLLERLEHDAAAGIGDEHYQKWIPLLQKKYRILVPLLFVDGPLHVFAPFKVFLLWVAGWFRPMMRGPFGRAEQQMWAIKTTALACENFMLALAAAGYDSCALEGFDEPRVKRLLGLAREARVAMVIAGGKKGPDAILPQIRFERSFYVQKI